MSEICYGPDLRNYRTTPGFGRRFSLIRARQNSESRTEERLVDVSKLNDLERDQATTVWKGENAKVDLEGLLSHISKLLEWVKGGKISSQKPKAAQQYWPTSDQSFVDLKTLLHQGINANKFNTQLDATAIATTILQGMNLGSMVTAGFLVVANILERIEDVCTNQNECVDLLKEMLKLAKLVSELKNPKGELGDEIKAATALIVEGSILCCTQIESSKFSRFFRTSIDKMDINKTKEKLDSVYRDLHTKLLISIYQKLDERAGCLPKPEPQLAPAPAQPVIINIINPAKVIFHAGRQFPQHKYNRQKSYF